MKCPNCGTDSIADGSLFCPECGSPLAPGLDGAPGQEARSSAPADQTMVMVDGQPAAPAPAQAPSQMSTAPMHGGSAAAPGAAPPAGTSSGVSVKVVIALVAAIVVLVGIVAVLLVNPFGSSEKDAKQSEAASSASEQTSVTLNSAPSQITSDPSSEASDQAAEPESAPAAETATGQSAADPEATHGLQGSTSNETGSAYEQEDLYYNTPFWGAWIGAFSELSNAQARLSEANAKGLPAIMFETTDWENLNPTHYWVISVGRSTDEFTAQRLCAQAIDAGYSDAYVKYSGNHR